MTVEELILIENKFVDYEGLVQQNVRKDITKWKVSASSPKENTD